jgi:ribosomal protein S18 acetylase RimI-like enzyme
MQTIYDFSIENPAASLDDRELVRLLMNSYVGGGFTSAELAVTLFEPSAVRKRGDLIIARSKCDDALAGMVIVVPPNAPGRRIAEIDECELHLLAVDPSYCGRGLGRTLIAAALESIVVKGFRKAILWTQPKMIVAQRLYEKSGFTRIASRDPIFDRMQFLAYEKQW